MAKVSADPVFGALHAAGIADNNTRRVVIDIQAGHLPVVYIERFGDEQLLNVVQTLQGVEITRDEGGK